MDMTGLKRAIEKCGGVSALAARLGTTQSAVSNWLLRESLPPERVLPIEQATGGQVTRHELRPDLYPREAMPTAQPAEKQLGAA
jgi:DNA-binding transcriptional regulator YdaS (Cro superfamily)